MTPDPGGPRRAIRHPPIGGRRRGPSAESVLTRGGGLLRAEPGSGSQGHGAARRARGLRRGRAGVAHRARRGTSPFLPERSEQHLVPLRRARERRRLRTQGETVPLPPSSAEGGWRRRAAPVSVSEGGRPSASFQKLLRLRLGRRRPSPRGPRGTDYRQRGRLQTVPTVYEMAYNMGYDTVI